MLLYLDAKDLINVIDKGQPCTADEFEHKLRAQGHLLVLSAFNVLEISAPLLQKGAQTNVMSLLNRIEDMPVCYIAEARIHFLELQEAAQAFREEREYRGVNPFVKRWDETLTINRKPLTRLYLNYTVAETVFDLWRINHLNIRSSLEQAHPLRVQFEADRGIPKPISLRENFLHTVERDLTLYRLPKPAKLEQFANWIYDVPSRCPSLRLSYEVFHQFLKNIRHNPDRNAIPDFAHLCCAPYVDLITLDSSMRTYAKQASRATRPELSSRFCKDVQEVSQALSLNPP